MLSVNPIQIIIQPSSIVQVGSRVDSQIILQVDFDLGKLRGKLQVYP